MKPIYLVCGVPCSGKTWVCSQLTDKFNYIPHDNYTVETYSTVLLNAAQTSDKPIIAEAPFRVSILLNELRQKGLTVHEYYIVEDLNIVTQRYLQRTGKPYPKAFVTNWKKYAQREPRFASVHLLHYLRSLNA